MQINFFKREISFKKKRLAPDPNFYWKIIMLSLFALTMVSFVFGYYMFNQVKDDAIGAGENATKKQPVEQEKIKKALEYFSVREKKSTEIINFPSSIVDPSL